MPGWREQRGGLHIGLWFQPGIGLTIPSWDLDPIHKHRLFEEITNSTTKRDNMVKDPNDHYGLHTGLPLAIRTLPELVVVICLITHAQDITFRGLT
jgi:hypothetical protein